MDLSQYLLNDPADALQSFNSCAIFAMADAGEEIPAEPTIECVTGRANVFSRDAQSGTLAAA